MIDLHQEITDKIISKIEAGNLFWNKPWNGSANLAMPVNGATGQPYHGVNVLNLWMANEENGYDSNEFMTFNQALQKKQPVKRGEKGHLIIFYKDLEKEDDDKVKHIPVIKHSYVFNRCQLEGYKYQERDETPLFERLAKVDEYLKNTGAKVHHDGGNRAYYSRVTDDIHMPEISAFKSPEGYYGTETHEIGHYTWKPERCNRQLGKRFGDKEYAMEELVAELYAAFTCCKLEITKEPRDDHAAYIETWLEVLHKDKKAIPTAASEATKADAWTEGCQHRVVPLIQPRPGA